MGTRPTNFGFQIARVLTAYNDEDGGTLLVELSRGDQFTALVHDLL